MLYLEDFEFMSDMADSYLILSQVTRNIEKKERCLRKAKRLIEMTRRAKEEQLVREARL